MFDVKPLAAASKSELYASLRESVAHLLAGERDRIANAANFAALLYHSLPDLNWAGFYFVADDELIVGPFQGKPACVRIALGKGVCGTAARDRRSILVPDVEAFPGHIACDAASRSELVVPLLRGDHVVGVWDMDSPVAGRFDEEDQSGCESLVSIFLDHTNIHE